MTIDEFDVDDLTQDNITTIEPGDLLLCDKKGGAWQRWLVLEDSGDTFKTLIFFSHNRSYLKAGTTFEFYKNSMRSWVNNSINIWRIQRK